MILSNEYQYIGRSSAVKAYVSDYYYYILLYAKTAGDITTGQHTVSVKMRLACDKNSSFYGFYTDGSVIVGDKSAISWKKQKTPATYWGDSTSLTEDGVTYRRWVDLGEGTVVLDTAYEQEETTIVAAWQRLSISTTPPNWLPSTTEAKASLTVTLPAIERPDVPDDEYIPPEDTLPDDEYTPGEDAPATNDRNGVTVYADGALVYDSRLEDYGLIGLKITTGVNVGGTAEITLPREHPAYNYFVYYRTIVTVYRGKELRFRGRALYYADNAYGQRTVTCEGERCLLRDAINRPYSYQSTPAKIFRHLVQTYNEQVEDFKQFSIGAATVADPNEYITMENENAESVLDTMDKLQDRCGGYITFSTKADGTRAINYLAALDQRSGQQIEFGENLLDFSTTGTSTDSPANCIVPYGARDEETQKRLTIESVNGGRDYVIAEDARVIRGTIMVSVTWDDVTDPRNLLKKAKAYLDKSKIIITAIEITALDLSYLDKNVDSFTVGDFIRVVSVPHGVNEDFQLTQLTEDLLNPANSHIVLGKDIPSLTGKAVSGVSA